MKEIMLRCSYCELLNTYMYALNMQKRDKKIVFTQSENKPMKMTDVFLNESKF